MERRCHYSIAPNDKESKAPVRDRTRREAEEASSRALGEELEIEIQSHQSDNCDICKNNKPFRLHPSLVSEFKGGNVVVFAGAGISTESRDVIGYTFLEEICSLLKIDPKRSSFPDAMEAFANQPNGRLELVGKIKKRLDYVDSFPDLRRSATRFHAELATLYTVDTIVTTNWDMYFENSCGAQSFTISQDFAFWGVSSRKVLKIHGSISNFGTLVATRKDYDKNTEELRNGVLGSFLKTLLSTRTIVFFGYSARDEDFNQILEFIRSQLGQFGRQHYIVTIESEEQELKRFTDLGLVPICTDAAYFLHALKETLQSDERYVPDEMYDVVDDQLADVLACHRRVHDKFNVFDDPEIILCASYQDGLTDAYERILNLRPSGTYSNRDHVHNVVHGYVLWQKEKLQAGKFADAAYMEGYLNAMTFVAAFGETGFAPPPNYFLFAKKGPLLTETLAEFSRELKKLRKTKGHHRGAFREAKLATKELDPKQGKKIIIEHKCQLL